MDQQNKLVRWRDVRGGGGAEIAHCENQATLCVYVTRLVRVSELHHSTDCLCVSVCLSSSVKLCTQGEPHMAVCGASHRPSIVNILLIATTDLGTLARCWEYGN